MKNDFEWLDFKLWKASKQLNAQLLLLNTRVILKTRKTETLWLNLRSKKHGLIDTNNKNNMELDFNNTCPTIDENIDNFKNKLEYTIIYILDELEINKRDKEIQDYAVQYVLDNYNADFSGIFEDLRQTNIDMRGAANEQLSELHTDTENTLEVKEEELYVANLLISNLEEEIAELKFKLTQGNR